MTTLFTAVKLQRPTIFRCFSDLPWVRGWPLPTARQMALGHVGSVIGSSLGTPGVVAPATDTSLYKRGKLETGMERLFSYVREPLSSHMVQKPAGVPLEQPRLAKSTCAAMLLSSWRR